MALNPLVSLFGCLVARSGRVMVTDRRMEDRPSTITLAAHARRGLTMNNCMKGTWELKGADYVLEPLFGGQGSQRRQRKWSKIVRIMQVRRFHAKNHSCPPNCQTTRGRSSGQTFSTSMEPHTYLPLITSQDSHR